jgi:hypothetical protein
MNCIVYSAESFLQIPELASFVETYMTKSESDFRKKLSSGEVTGSIAVVFDVGNGGVIGWARTEEWFDAHGGYWDTLEAFVDEKRRGSGVASFAAAGLRASGAFESGAVAVFEPRMLMIAQKAGVHATLFTRKDAVTWVEA